MHKRLRPIERCPKENQNFVSHFIHIQIFQIEISSLSLILTLLKPAYLRVSKNQGGVAHCAPPQNILGLGGVMVPILFGNDLLWDDLPYSKGFMKFGCLEPSKVMFDFWNIL